MTPQQLHILQHSLGVDQYGRGTMYRNHFVTGTGSLDHPDCMALVEAGFMTRHDGEKLPFGGDDYFQVTKAGKKAMQAQSPQPPKPTRGQARYQRYLDADSGLSFGQWLKSSAWARP